MWKWMKEFFSFPRVRYIESTELKDLSNKELIRILKEDGDKISHWSGNRVVTELLSRLLDQQSR